MESNIQYSQEKELTAQTVDATAQAMYRNNMANLAENQQLEVYRELTNMVYKTQFITLQNAIPQIKQFIVDETKFGEGYRQVMVDVLKISDFTKESWWPENAVTAEAREVFVKQLMEFNIRGDKNEYDLFKKFKDASETAKFLNEQSEAASRALAIFYQQLIWNILQTSDTPNWSVLIMRKTDGTVDSEATQVWTEKMNGFVKMARNALRKKVEVEYEVLSNDLHNEKYYRNRAMMVSIMTDIALATEKVRTDNAAGDSGDGKVYNERGELIDAYQFHSKPDINKITVVLNQETMISMNTDVRATTFNNELLKLPDAKVLQISSLDKDTYKIIDDRLIQISPNIRVFGIFPRNIYTLVVLGNYVEKTWIGFNPYLYGKEVKMVKKVVEKLKEPNELENIVIKLSENSIQFGDAIKEFQEIIKKQNEKIDYLIRIGKHDEAKVGSKK